MQRIPSSSASQVSTTAAMHAARLSGLGANGRIGKSFASALQAIKITCFKNGWIKLRVVLSAKEVNSHAGRERIEDIVGALEKNK